MNRRFQTLLLTLAVVPAGWAQSAPLSRAEVLGRLAQGESASYLAHLVESHGVSFTPTADFLDRVKQSGGEGILVERLASATPPPGLNATQSDRSFVLLAKCSELIHIGATEQALSECHAAVDENPESAWPIMLLLRVLSETGISQDERLQLLRKAAALEPNLVSAHRALAMADLPLQERDEELQRVDVLERSQAEEAYSVPDASTFDHGYSELPRPESISLEKQKQLRDQMQSALRDYPDLAATHLSAAFTCFSLGELESGRTQIREALRLEPGNPELHIALAHFYHAQLQSEAELAEYRAAIRIAPYQNLPRRFLTDALVREQRPRDAIQQWKEFLLLSPRDLQASDALITLYLDQHDRDSAIAELRRSLKASSDVSASEADFVDFRLNDLDRLAHLLTDNAEYENASQQYAYLLRFKTDSAILHNNLGNVFYAHGRCTEAADEYREALRLQSDLPDAHHNLANCLLATQKTDEAIAEYRQTLELDPTRTYSRAMLGVALTNKGELNAAVEQFQQYLAEDPNNADVLANLAHAHYLNRDYASAIAELKQVLLIKPGSPAVENELAWIYATADDSQFKNPREALRLAQLAVHSSHEPAPEFLDTLAEALLQNGDSATALSTEERAAEIAPESKEIQVRLGRFREGAQPQTASNP
jgi:tetratricopeptide (TPR) repeat protein